MSSTVAICPETINRRMERNECDQVALAITKQDGELIGYHVEPLPRGVEGVWVDLAPDSFALDEAEEVANIEVTLKVPHDAKYGLHKEFTLQVAAESALDDVAEVKVSIEVRTPWWIRWKWGILLVVILLVLLLWWLVTNSGNMPSADAMRPVGIVEALEAMVAATG